MTKEHWEESLKAWNDVKKNALLQLEQAEVIIPAIENKIKEYSSEV